MTTARSAIPFILLLPFILPLLLMMIISPSTSINKNLSQWTSSLPHELQSLDIANRLHFDSEAIKLASTDYGKIVRVKPAAVLYPISVKDIITLIKFSYNSPTPFRVAARGRGHSVKGQAMAKNGVVVKMTSLKHYGMESGIRVFGDPSLGFCADVGGEELWIDVLRNTLEHGLAPVSWTDYLYLTVGGTLSNAGISGQTFLHGPQISNVDELDVITGKGELVTCSKHGNSDLFYAVLGGLGQFGIITRARIPLQRAPNRVKWARLMYHDFSAFTRDQEHLISINGLDYLEGSLIMQKSPPSKSRGSFFSPSDRLKINSLVTKHGLIYFIEAVKYYDDLTINTVDKELDELFRGLSFLPGFIFQKDSSLLNFLNRARFAELTLQEQGLSDVPHPWLNLFVPKSRIMDFNEGVFVEILHKQNMTTGLLVLVYPMNRNKWDERMSAVVPDEDTFYTVGLLRSSGENEWEVLENQNKAILEFCDKAGINVKHYLYPYTTKTDWINHFGYKWDTFQERKYQFDPKIILSPGQRIFTSV